MTACPQCSLILHKLFPFLRWKKMVTRETLRADLIAGLTGAIIVLPQGVAFAMIAGMPPEYGLYTAIIPAIIAALFGSSHHLISGPTTAISIVVMSTLAPMAEPGSAEFIQLAFTLTFMAGLFQLGFGLARLGTLINFVSHTVVIGFTAGAAILIATSQMKHFFGVPVERGASFLHTWMQIIPELPDSNPRVVTIALVTLLVAVGLRIYRRKWPGMLIAMVVGGLISLLLDGEAHGVKLVGELPSSLPPFSHPNIDLDTWKVLASGAAAIALLGLVEAVSISRSVAAKSQQRIDGNQEFIGQGMANIVGSFFSSYASSGSFTRTGVNFTAGARTPMSAVFAAVLLAAVILLIAPLTAYLPIPAMAGILLLVAYNLIDFHHIGEILKSSRSETAVLLTTFFATLFLELEFAIYAGVLLSLMLYLNRTSRPSIATMAPDTNEIRHPLVNIACHPELSQCPQMRILRIDGSVFFGAVNNVGVNMARLHEQNPEQKHVLIVGNTINFIDLAGVDMFIQEHNRYKLAGGGLYMSNLKTAVLDEVKKKGLDRHVQIFDSKPEAIQGVFLKLDRDICRSCDKRIFHECASVKPAKRS